MRHKENNHHFDLVDEREEVEQSCDVVENRVEDPISGPMCELCVVGLFASELG